MKKLFDEDETEIHNLDKAKILVSVIPVVLIVIILAITLLVNGGKKDDSGDDDLQQSIMDYADDAMPSNSDSVSETSGKDDEEPDTEEKGSQGENSDSKEETSTQTEAPSPTPYQQIMNTDKVDYSKVSFDKDEQLKEMMTYWADNNQKALDDLANLDRFKAMSWKLRDSSDFYYYGDKNAAGLPEGNGIAVYADNQYYYGEWKDGLRSGNGTWIHYHIHNTDNKSDLYLYHQYTGSWAKDLPDGEGSEHYDYDTTLFKENMIYCTNLIGSYAAGLVDGEFYITSTDANENYKEWNATAENGSWFFLSDKRDSVGRGPVYVSTKDSNNYFWMRPKENKNIGVPCLISKQNKN